jgi:hypothetical protein
MDISNEQIDDFYSEIDLETDPAMQELIEVIAQEICDEIDLEIARDIYDEEAFERYLLNRNTEMLRRSCLEEIFVLDYVVDWQQEGF